MHPNKKNESDSNSIAHTRRSILCISIKESRGERRLFRRHCASIFQHRLGTTGSSSKRGVAIETESFHTECARARMFPQVHGSTKTGTRDSLVPQRKEGSSESPLRKTPSSARSWQSWARAAPPPAQRPYSQWECTPWGASLPTDPRRGWYDGLKSASQSKGAFPFREPIKAISTSIESDVPECRMSKRT